MEFVLSELCEQVVTARAAQRPVMIRGGGTRQFYGEPVGESSAWSWLEMSAYRGLISYEPSELVLTARAGTPLAEIEALVAQQNQMLAFEPPRFGEAGTLGGCVATGLSGPRRMAAGGLSDYVLGTRLLSADGNVLHFGGEVMKNVAGYDLSRLLAGSLGVLGVLVEVSLKVMPRPQAEATRVLAVSEDEALHRCLGWRAQPIPVTATAWIPDGAGETGRLYVRVSGNDSAVRQAQVRLGGEALDASQAEAFWLSIRDQTHPFFQARPLWRVMLPAGSVPLALGPTLHEWGGCMRWVSGEQDPEALRARVAALGGSACLYRRAPETPAAWPTFTLPAPGVLRIHQRLKQEFDPAGIFNPRRLFPGL